MPRIDPTSGPNQVPLTAEQQASLAKLHQSAQQLEGLFINMLFKSMRESAPDTSITGKVSESEKTFNEMLDQERADKLAQTGSLGIAKIIEQQLRATVLGTQPAALASKAGGQVVPAPVQPPAKPLTDQEDEQTP
jgi:flagellar protein FlgJ